MTKAIAVASDVFERFPGYVRGLVFGRNVENGPTHADLAEALAKAEDQLRSLPPDDARLQSRVGAWRDAFKTLGVRASDYRPSVDALVRRVQRGDRLPRITNLVDIGTLVTLQHILPVGAHALDEVRTTLELRFSRGDEVFEPFGGESEEIVPAGELIYVEEKRVATRKWAWRQGKHTLVVPTTRIVEFNVDVLPPAHPSELEDIFAAVTDLGSRYCGGEWSFTALTASIPKTAVPGGVD